MLRICIVYDDIVSLVARYHHDKNCQISVILHLLSDLDMAYNIVQFMRKTKYRTYKNQLDGDRSLIDSVFKQIA